ncbi:MAG: NAD-glutamate dehydrogenase [bacterium]
MVGHQYVNEKVLLKEITRQFKANKQSGSEVKQLEALAKQFYARVPMEDLEDQPPHRLAAIVTDLNQFMKERVEGDTLIRVFNPEMAEHGWESRYTVVEVVLADMPFLVDSVGMAIRDVVGEMVIELIIHPLINVLRDAGGFVLDFPVDQNKEGVLHESVLHFHIHKQTEPHIIQGIKDKIQSALHDVRMSVKDWQAIRVKAEECAESLVKAPSIHSKAQIDEASKFIQWLADDHFTFLGYREYRTEVRDNKRYLLRVCESGLGLLNDPNCQEETGNAVIADDDDWRQTYTQPLILTKTNARSTVHRAGFMDYVGVLLFDEDGHVVGEKRFIGLYTSSAYYRRPWEIPFIRMRVDDVVQRSGVERISHDGKALLHIMETLPRDEMMQASVEDIYELTIGVLNLQERQRTRLFIRRDRFGRFYSCLVFVPRERFNTEIRNKLQHCLAKALKAERVDFEVSISGSALARLHVIIRSKEGAEIDYDQESLESEIIQIVQSWKDELRDVLVERFGDDRGIKLANKYAYAFPAAYVEDVSPWVAAYDVENVDDLKDGKDLKMSLYRPRNKRVGLFRFKIFHFEHTIPLSDVLPLLENMGLRVVTERPYELQMENGSVIWIQDFDIVPAQAEDLNVELVREEFEAAFLQVIEGRAENDGFNRLILGAGLRWKQVVLLRAVCKYLLQTGIPFSQNYMERTLADHPDVARLLIEYFEALFDPSRIEESPFDKEAKRVELEENAQKVLGIDFNNIEQSFYGVVLAARVGSLQEQVESIKNAIGQALEQVNSLDEDRILRSFSEVIQAMLRTNYYQLSADGDDKDYLSFKLDSDKVPHLPKPKPLVEIFVYSPRVEGVHLRGGRVARGGLRWSDRPEDFRTEVLGLMKAQMVKNTMIVPVGAKGGFIVKQMPQGDRAHQMSEVVHCYRCFISGLLDITDNLKGDDVIHPLEVVRQDDDDTYLVVAADKGTATFSDIANSVADQYDFWLGDAFASGGSVGYDHKGMGITAKGAWESVKRHFREMGIDCQTTEFSCVGIGDMAGDVFGNGMLLSKHIQLKAAFNHMHIFLDPTPNTAKSFVERQRLFNLPRSSWEDYNQKLISKGGGLFLRSAKSIPLSEEVQQWLGLEVDHLTPAELIRELIKAPVDLLWNGGIGTYIKSSTESHTDVGDHANDGVRVNGQDLRCRIVGEGGNLGATQLGRVEFALKGGRINSDFVDNSAGVDCSDHEVNIKILLNGALEKGMLNDESRKELLASMTEEVGTLVLRNNYLQNQALSMMEALAVKRIGAKAHFITQLERTGLLDRQIEYLPSGEEIQERRVRGQGLVRPELAVLLSYAKIKLNLDLLDSDIPEDPFLSAELKNYFPKPLQENFAELMPEHRLKREIIATQVTNTVINRMGATFVLRMQEDTGAHPSEISKAFTVAVEVFGANQLWDSIESLDNLVSSRLQVEMVQRLWNLLRHITRWILNHYGQNLDIAALVNHYSPGVTKLISLLQKVIDQTEKRGLVDVQAELLEQGVPRKLARHVASFISIYPALDIVDVSEKCEQPVERVAKVYYAVGEAFNFNWLRDQIESLTVEGQWHANARAALRDELYQHHADITAAVLCQASKKTPKKLLQLWIDDRRRDVDYMMHMLGDMKSSPSADYAMVSVALRGIAHLLRNR